MNSSVVLRQLVRNSVKPGKNGVNSNLAAYTRVSRAFAIVPIRAASSLTSNKAITFPNMSKASNPQQFTVRNSSSDHVKLWTAERVMSVTLLGAIPAAILVPSPAIEAFLALSITLHSHWGIEAIVDDYIRPSVFGNKIPVICQGLVYGFSIMTLGSLLYFIYSDVGLVNAVTMLWKL